MALEDDLEEIRRPSEDGAPIQSANNPFRTRASRDEHNSEPAPSKRRLDSFRTASFTSASTANGSVFASTDSLLLPRATGNQHELHQEPSLWYSFPIIFAIVPALGGIAFKKGSLIITDIALVTLAAIYLNWCLTAPWIWYHAAQTTRTIGTKANEEAIIAEDEEVLGNQEGAELKDTAGGQEIREADQVEADAARSELKLHQLVALSLCFIGPLAGSYLLHVIRGQLSQVGHHLVSDLHLSLFVLAAEIRPLLHAMKMLQARTLFLQKFVKAPHGEFDSMEKPAALADLAGRLDQLEASLAERIKAVAEAAGPNTTSSDAAKKMQAALQGQIDALNRGMRRYEKRATAQTMQTEGRLRNVESRLQDALSLAAAAASFSRKSGVIDSTMHTLASMIALPAKAFSAVVLSALRTASRGTVAVLTMAGVIRLEERQKPNRQLKQTTRSTQRN